MHIQTPIYLQKQCRNVDLKTQYLRSIQSTRLHLTATDSETTANVFISFHAIKLNRCF